MIIGIGTDLVAIERIEKILAEFGDRFLNRVFSPEEIAKANGGQNPAKTLASRFAAKEAAAKAMGLAIRQGIRFRDFSVSNDPLGKPILSIEGMAAEHLKSMVPAGYKAKIHLSLSEEKSMAVAVVIISVTE